MDIHVCKQCGSQFVYCRACVFRPIRYKDNGFCSKECYEASKIKVVPTIEFQSMQVENIIEDSEIIHEETSVISEVKAEAIALTEVPVAETAKVVESTIKKETNTYRKKKSKN